MMSALRRPPHDQHAAGMISLPDTHAMSLPDAAAAWARLGLRICYENEDGERPAGNWKYLDRDKTVLKEPDTPERARFLASKYDIKRLCVEPATNMVVLDIDHRPAKGWCAVAIGKELRYTFSLPPCPIVKTPSGGYHLWLQLPDGFKARNWTSAHGKFPVEGVDVRTFGGLATVPPSTRHETEYKPGGAYEWIGPCRTIPMVTPSLVEALTPPQPPEIPTYERRPYTGEIHPWIATMLNAQLQEVATCGTGGRNAQLFKSGARIASFVAGGELPDGASRAALYNAANACGLVKEDGSRAVLATIQSAFAAGLQQPRNRPEGQE